MATWDSYTQKATPEDNDTLMIKDTVGAANKRTPFSGVWNWIVNKLTSAVISNLQTNSKSIIPAINELNSKSAIILDSDSATQISFACEQTAKYFIVAQASGSNGDNGLGPAVLTIAPNYRMDNLKVVTIFQNNDINPDITISSNVITMRFKTGDEYIGFFKALIFRF